MKKSANKLPLDTRGRILQAAFVEFYVNGFQGGGINNIIEKAASTKGALFHHFPHKQALGYAIVDEIIYPELKKNWFDRLASSIDPIKDLKDLFRRSMKEDIDTGRYRQGCPLNNLALEMSQLDEGFRKRIERVYEEWRGSLEAALARGIKAGEGRKKRSAQDPGILIISVQTCMCATANNSRKPEVMRRCAEELFSDSD